MNSLAHLLNIVEYLPHISKRKGNKSKSKIMKKDDFALLLYRRSKSLYLSQKVREIKNKKPPPLQTKIIRQGQSKKPER